MNAEADFAEYVPSELEEERVNDLLSLSSKRSGVVLDAGTRRGRIALRLVPYFSQVVALDLQRPRIHHPKIACIQGDITALPFGDHCFDMVVCAEVLEHIPSRLLSQACAELTRVAKGALVIGVPYRQDLRVGRTSCSSCGAVNPPWGHVNSFSEEALYDLFKPLVPIQTTYVGANRAFTNAVSAALMNFSGNPFGTYDQLETCCQCGANLVAPKRRSFAQRVTTRLATLTTRLQRQLRSPRPNWVHVLFETKSA
jgi:SAM-dependent methyltransferase